jgi:hypothetical protein
MPGAAGFQPPSRVLPAGWRRIARVTADRPPDPKTEVTMKLFSILVAALAAVCIAGGGAAAITPGSIRIAATGVGLPGSIQTEGAAQGTCSVAGALVTSACSWTSYGVQLVPSWSTKKGGVTPFDAFATFKLPNGTLTLWFEERYTSLDASGLMYRTTASWHVVDGTGAYAGVHGKGRFAKGLYDARPTTLKPAQPPSFTATIVGSVA